MQEQEQEAVTKVNVHQDLKSILIVGSRFSKNRKFLIENYVRTIERNYSERSDKNKDPLFVHIREN